MPQKKVIYPQSFIFFTVVISTYKPTCQSPLIMLGEYPVWPSNAPLTAGIHQQLGVESWEDTIKIPLTALMDGFQWIPMDSGYHTDPHFCHETH